MDFKYLIIRTLQRVVPQYQFHIDDQFVELFNQEANDYVLEELSKGKPCMISKFGTVELSNIISVELNKSIYPNVLYDAIKGKISLFPKNVFNSLCLNAGFFPNDIKYTNLFHDRVIDDLKDIDILGSYIYSEKYINKYLNCKRINLDGYYAPFLWKNPWTKWLKGKRVLVIHPFVDSIKYQYEINRKKIFKDSDVLPEFKELILIKAIQSIANQKDNRFENWFEALKYMEDEISKQNFDIALIGCGAYGMCLAAYVKRMGKQAVHMAGWIQMLFGIYGNRWIRDQKVYSSYINDSWIRPLDKERPQNADKVEGGCYW